MQDSVKQASVKQASVKQASVKQVCVKFEYSDRHNYCEKVFFQPLFFIGMNMKHNFLKENGQPFNENMLSAELQLLPSPDTDDTTHPFKMEMAPSFVSEQDFNLNYILDRYCTDQIFTYKGVQFQIKSDHTDVKKCSLRIGCDEHTVTSAYEIIYASSAFVVFEDLIKTSVLYFKKYSSLGKPDKNLKMFISSEDGSYFENIGSRPKRALDTVFLPAEQKKNIIQLITNFIEPATAEKYKKYGINHKLTILLEGTPGTGKTSLIAALASHFNFDIAIISFTPKMTDVNFMRAMRIWERKVNKEENKNENDRDTILVIEDMDCIFKERKSNDEARNMVTFSGILNTLDGITTCENQIVFLTSNHIEFLDPALIRPGRVDHIMRFDYATKEQIKEIFNVYAKPEPGTTLAQKFYEAVQGLNIKITTSLLQQYLFKYAEKIDLIMENIDEMKNMYDSCNKSCRSGEAKMYT